ncbi:unnamed protein product [Gadus morhua 'NCC']
MFSQVVEPLTKHPGQVHRVGLHGVFQKTPPNHQVMNSANLTRIRRMSGCRQPGTAEPHPLTRLQEDVREIVRPAELALPLPLPLPLLPILLAKRRKVVHQAEVAGMTGIKLAGNQTISPSLQPLDPGGLLRSWIATCQLTS